MLDTSSPNKFFESLAAGIPVVQNTNGWMRTFLEQHQLGFTLSPEDPEALANTLIELDAKPQLLETMGKRAAVVAAREFDKQVLALKMITAIEDLEK